MKSLQPLQINKPILMLQYKNDHIRANTDTTKDHNKKIYRKIKSSKTKQKSPQVERKRLYIGNLSKNSSEEDIAKLFGFRTTPYLSENCFIEMSTGRKNRNYAFITAPEHICNELIKLNGVTFQDMCLKVQDARQSDTRFSEKRNITKSSFERNLKNAADSIYSPNRFELLNCETTENDVNDHPYHKDMSIVGIDTINHHSRYKQLKRPQVVADRFP